MRNGFDLTVDYGETKNHYLSHHRHKSPDMKITIYFLLLISFCTRSFAQFDCDILIHHGKIIDGTGNNWFYGDVAIRGSRIIYVGRNAPLKAAKVIDAN